jgi:hypothetical protein
MGLCIRSTRPLQGTKLYLTRGKCVHRFYELFPDWQSKMSFFLEVLLAMRVILTKKDQQFRKPLLVDYRKKNLICVLDALIDDSRNRLVISE